MATDSVLPPEEIETTAELAAALKDLVGRSGRSGDSQLAASGDINMAIDTGLRVPVGVPARWLKWPCESGGQASCRWTTLRSVQRTFEQFVDLMFP